MKHIYRNPRASILLMAVLASAGAKAQVSISNNGLYVGISAGESTAKFDNGSAAQSRSGSGITAGARVDDERGNAFKAFIGLPLSSHWAVEGGYFDLGHFGFDASTTPAGTVSGRTRIQGLNLDLVGRLPITERWSLLGRVGAAYAETQSRFSGTGAGAGSDASTSQRETHYKYGFGTQYAFSPALTVRLEGERYLVNDAVNQRANVDLISVGLVYRFGAPAQSVRSAYSPPASQPSYTPDPAPVLVQAPEETPSSAPLNAPMAMPAPAAVSPQAPMPEAKPWIKVMLQADALFGFDQDILQADGQQALNKLVQELQDVEIEAVQVAGHTDRLGSPAYNAGLSLRRAQAVRNHLVQVGGIPASLVTAVGLGETQAKTTANACMGMKSSQALITCLRVDRRVEVQVLGSQLER